ncbi:MAG: CDP-diacylglycerol--serine O-phosphatidyltransferase [Gemmatimonadota bacterium]|jgi:CDP-diacylglycerol--serine O-phosphatidyltransferase
MERPRRTLRGGVIIVPSALTLANLFFGMWAIVSATHGEFTSAAWLIVFAGIADMLDGRVARVTQTGSRFGGELDSLVDVISFGVAPALVIYFLFLSEGVWSWIAAFFYITGAVIRLARFNIEQAGHAKVAFHGLPSPAAGMLLATFYPFSRTHLFQEYLSTLPWPAIMTALLVVLALLMMSHVLYPVVPKFGFRTRKGIVTLVMLLAVLTAVLTIPSEFFFPALGLYVSYGVVKAFVLGLFERLPERDLLVDDDELDEADAELRPLDYEELAPPARLWIPRRRPRRRSSDEEPSTTTEETP